YRVLRSVGFRRGECKEDVGCGEAEVAGCFGLRERKAVKANLDFDDLLDPVCGAKLDFAFLDTARGVGNIRVLCADTAAEQFDSAASTGGLNNRRGCGWIFAPEVFCDGSCERIDSGGADDADRRSRH